MIMTSSNVTRDDEKRRNDTKAPTNRDGIPQRRQGCFRFRKGYATAVTTENATKVQLYLLSTADARWLSAAFRQREQTAARECAKTFTQTTDTRQQNRNSLSKIELVCLCVADSRGGPDS